MKGQKVDDPPDDQVALPQLFDLVQPVEQEQRPATRERLVQQPAHRQGHAELAVVVGNEAVQRHVVLGERGGVGRDGHEDGQAWAQPQRLPLAEREAQRQVFEQRRLARAGIAQDDQRVVPREQLQHRPRLAQPRADRGRLFRRRRPPCQPQLARPGLAGG